VKSFRLVLAALVVCCSLLGLSTPALAQYGGVSGLFVITTPTEPGVADFNGIGCAGGVEVVLYLPGIPPTAVDPVVDTPVSGRVIAVTRSVSSADPLRNGTFSFAGVRLPVDLEPGFYQFHARCGDLDLSVVIELTAGGVVTVTPEGEIDAIRDQIVNPPTTLPFTGRESSPLIAFAAALVAAGTAFIAVGKRRRPEVS
jgi:hypothetical protein